MVRLRRLRTASRTDDASETRQAPLGWRSIGKLRFPICRFSPLTGMPSVEARSFALSRPGSGCRPSCFTVPLKRVQPDALQCAGENLVGTVWGTVPFTGEDAGDLIVGHPGLRGFEQPIPQFAAPGQGGDRIYPHLHVEIGHCEAAPFDPGCRDISYSPVENHFFDQTAPPRLAVGIRGGQICPDLGQTTVNGHDLAVGGLAHRWWRDRSGRNWSGRGERSPGSPHLRQRTLPARLGVAGNQTVVQIDAIELTLCQSRSVPGALDLGFGRLRARHRIMLQPTSGTLDLGLGRVVDLPAGRARGFRVRPQTKAPARAGFFRMAETAEAVAHGWHGSPCG